MSRMPEWMRSAKRTNELREAQAQKAAEEEPPREIRPLLRRGMSMIPAGTRGRSRIARFLLGRDRESTALVKSNEGQTFCLPNLQDPIGFYMWLDGVYEPETLAFLKSATGPCDTFVDIGANVGVFTLPMARRAKQVIAIEASPAVADILERNVASNRLANVKVIRGAAGDSDAELDFFPAPSAKFGMGSTAPQFGAKPIRVPAFRLDDLVDSPAAIKVDVEGYEADVFRGATRILNGKNPPHLIFEFCEWAEERAFPGQCGLAQEVLMFFGYRVWTIEGFHANRPPLREPVRQGGHTLIATRM